MGLKLDEINAGLKSVGMTLEEIKNTVRILTPRNLIQHLLFTH
jgi:hypothetical protein